MKCTFFQAFILSTFLCSITSSIACPGNKQDHQPHGAPTRETQENCPYHTSGVSTTITEPHECVHKAHYEEINNLPVQLTIQAENREGLPYNFRTMRSPLSPTDYNLEGLRDLRAAGCGQFSEKEFSWALAEIRKDYAPLSPCQLHVLDLREESHGLLNGHGIDWYIPIYNNANFERDLEDILIRENTLLRELLLVAKPLTLHGYEEKKNILSRHLISVQNVKSEQALVQSFNVHYHRIPVTDHSAPELRDVDNFIALLSTIPEDAVMLVHCRGGMGRTTTYLAFIDMWHNAAKVPFEDIIKRQMALAEKPINLFKVKKENPLKSTYAQKRLDILKVFYEYARHKEIRGKHLFSTFYHSREHASVGNSS